MDTPLPRRDAARPADEHLLPTAMMASDLSALGTRYRQATPFPHICIDGMFDPSILDRVRLEWPDPRRRDWIVWDTKNEFKQTSRGIEGLSPFTQTFLLHLCTPPFLRFLEAITGHETLLPDPLFYGAGLMETFRGGWLEIHGDYTRHPRLPLSRRINLLIYLNHDWDPSWHGELELWDPKTTTCTARFLPDFNRTIIFDTTPDALHGHPIELACPEGRSRQLISVYYWSAADVDEAKPINWRRTRVPPLRALLRGCVPPIAYDVKDLLLSRRKRGAGISLFPRSAASLENADNNGRDGGRG